VRNNSAVDDFRLESRVALTRGGFLQKRFEKFSTKPFLHTIFGSQEYRNCKKTCVLEVLHLLLINLLT
jgi:hypothetical protein